MSKDGAFEKWHAAEVALLEWGIAAVKSDPAKVHELSRLVISYREAIEGRAREPQDPSTCPVGHPRACLRDIDMGQHTTKRGDNPPTRATFMCCGACLDQAEAVDAALLAVNKFILNKQMKLEEISGDAMAKIIMREIHCLREGRNSNFLDLERLEARLVEAEWWGKLTDGRTGEDLASALHRLADLDRQIEEKRVKL